MKNIILDQTKWTITDDFSDVARWVGISSGDIWLSEDQPFGFYLGYWIPNATEDLKLMVMTVDGSYSVDMVVGLSCQHGDINSLKPLDPELVPWGDWMGVEPLCCEEFDCYTKAKEALQIMAQVIQQDKSLAKYLGLADVVLNGEKHDSN